MIFLIALAAIPIHLVNSCVRTSSPDDMKTTTASPATTSPATTPTPTTTPTPSCTTVCTLPYTCAGVTAPGGVCEPLSAVGNPTVTTADQITCVVKFMCPPAIVGARGYQTWTQNAAGVWTMDPGSNADMVEMKCTAGNVWVFKGMNVMKGACAY